MPDYSTLCSRSASLSIDLPTQASSEPMHIVVDTDGLKIYGEGNGK